MKPTGLALMGSPDSGLSRHAGPRAQRRVGPGEPRAAASLKGGARCLQPPRPSPHEHPRKAASSAGEEPATPFKTSQLPTRVFPGTRGEDRPVRRLPRPAGAGESRRDAGGGGGAGGPFSPGLSLPPRPARAPPARLQRREAPGSVCPAASGRSTAWGSACEGAASPGRGRLPLALEAPGELRPLPWEPSG